MENYFIRFAHKSYISSYIIERQSRRERAALSCDSERKRAGSACNIHFINARKSVGSGSVFSLSFRSFRSFRSLSFRNKRERKEHFKKTFLFQNNSLTFFFFIAIKEEKSKQKRRNNASFSTTLRLWSKWM